MKKRSREVFIQCILHTYWQCTAENWELKLEQH